MPSALANSGQKVFVDPAEHVLGAGLLVAHLDVADEVDELAEPLLVEGGAGVVFGQHLLERRVVALDAGHGDVDELADGRLARLGLQMRPAGLRRHPEDVLGDVFVAVLGCLGAPFGQNRRMALLEGVGDVFQKDEAQDDVLVLGRVHAAAQGVCHAPKLGLIARGGAVSAGLCVRVGACFCRLCACHGLLFSGHRCVVNCCRLWPQEQPGNHTG